MNLLRKSVASIALSTMVVAIAAPSVGAYSDASYEAAAALAAQGIINMQDSAAGYNLGQNVLRQEIAKVAANIAGVTPTATCAGQFMDVSATTPNDWACGYVEALLGEGLISANAYFNPESNITKSEAVKMMLEAAGFTGIYTDAANWQEEVVAFAVENGVLAKGFTDYNAYATRGFVFEQANASIEVLSSEDEGDILGDLLAGLGDIAEDPVVDPAEDPVVDPAEDPVVDPAEDPVVDPATDEEAVLKVELSPESPANGNVAAGVSRTALLAVTVTAGSEDVTLKQATLDYTGLSDSRNIDDVSIYMGNDKVSKTRNFSDNDLDLDFDKDVVIEAGQTATLTIAATIEGGTVNESHQITLSNLDASVDVEGDDIAGATLTPVEVSNKAVLEVNADRATDTATIGETIKLAGFKLEETADNEDVLVKGITFTVEGGIDAENDLTNLVLTADGEEVGGDLHVNSDDEIVADLDLTIPQDEKVEFELSGVIIGSVGSDIDVVFKSNDDIYAVGKTTGVNVSFDTATEAADADISSTRTIEGSEINVSFDKSDIDEAKPNAEDILVGTLNLLATTDDYEVKTITVDVTSTTGMTDAEIKTAVEELELDGTTYDSVDGTTYTFEDIELNSGEQMELPLTFTLADDYSLNGESLNFDVNITKIEDTEENDTYTVNGATYDISTILSSTALDDKDVDIESASFTMTDVDVIDRDLVLGDGIETVVYKAKISIGDADAVTINDFNLKTSPTHSLLDENNDTIDLDKIIDSATLTVGGSIFDADIDANSIDFTPNAEIEAGADNVEVLVTVVLKDNDSVTANSVLSMMFDPATVDLEDSDNENLVSANIKVANANDKITDTNLLDRGTFDIAVVTNSDNTDDIENVVLAGSSNVALAEVTLQAEHEDMDVESLKFNIAASETGGNPALTATLNEVTSGSPATPEGYTGGDEKTFTVSETLETGDTVYLTYDDINSAGGDDETISTTVSSTHAAAMASLASTLEGKDDVMSATVSGNTITVKGYDNTVESLATRTAALVNAEGSNTATVSGDTVTITAVTAEDRATNITAADANGVVSTETTTNEGVDAVAQQSTATIGGTFDVGDQFTITINGVDYTHTVVAGDTNNVGIAAALATLVDADGAVSAANGGSNVVTIDADTAGTAFTIATSVVDANSMDATNVAATPTANVVAEAEVTTIQFTAVATAAGNYVIVGLDGTGDTDNLAVSEEPSFGLSYPGVSGDKTATVATVKTSVSTNDVTTLTVESASNIAMQAGDSVTVTVEGETYTATTLDLLAAAINADNAGVAAVNGADTILTITKVAAPFAVSDLSATAKAGTVTGDFSDTLNNVRLVDGNGSVIADGATVTYDADNTNTVIEFEDFTVTDSSNSQDVLLVADIETYTTNGGETSATLGDIVVNLQDDVLGDVKGANSNDDIVVAINTADESETVSVVPILMTVSVTDEFGTDDTEAKIEVTVDKGNNEFDDDTIRIQSLKFESIADANTIGTVSNDENVDLTRSALGSATITLTDTNADSTDDLILNSGDVITFSNSTVTEIVKISKNGVTFTVDGNTYTSSNEDILDLKNYAN